jgi:hypothetical protein
MPILIMAQLHFCPDCFTESVIDVRPVYGSPVNQPRLSCMAPSPLARGGGGSREGVGANQSPVPIAIGTWKGS